MKQKITLLATLALLSFGGPQQINANTQGEITNKLKGTEHHVGEIFGGGIVFYVYTGDDGTQHGLIVSLTEISQGVAWGKTNLETKATDQASGAKNTSAILSAGGSKTDAAGLCDAYQKDTFTDWFLPSVDEMKHLHKSLSEINKALEGTAGAEKIESNFYWTSTENARGSAMGFDFTKGEASMSNKLRNAAVRAVRAF